MSLGAALVPDYRVHGVLVDEDSNTSELTVVLLRWRDAVQVPAPASLRPSILGYVRAEPARCSGAWTSTWQPYTVRASFADAGWGPAVYDALFAAIWNRRGRYGWLMPDRRGVSSAARGLWRRYLLGRTDITTTRLPDSCVTLSPDPQDPLFQHAYQLKRAPGPGAATLRRYGDHAAAALARTWGVSRWEAGLRVGQIAAAMFGEVLREGRRGGDTKL